MRAFRGGLWLLFPMFGIGLGWLFRTSETDLRSFSPAERVSAARKQVPLPDGRLLRWIGVPDPAGGTAFWLGEMEVDGATFRLFDPSHRGVGWAATVSLAEAEAFSEWLGGRVGREVRLQQAAEWRWAARMLWPEAETAWGFGVKNPPAGVAFAKTRPPVRPGPPLGAGFRDLAGGVWEWTAEGLLLGGAWAEQNPDWLRLDRAFRPPEGYAGADTGFRLWMEALPGE